MSLHWVERDNPKRRRPIFYLPERRARPLQLAELSTYSREHEFALPAATRAAQPAGDAVWCRYRRRNSSCGWLLQSGASVLLGNDRWLYCKRFGVGLILSSDRFV